MPTPKFTIERLTHEDVIRFRGEFPLRLAMTLDLDRLDRALLTDAPTNKNAADHLLVLEMLFRRYSEQRVTPSKPTASTDAPAPRRQAPASPDAPRGS